LAPLFSKGITNACTRTAKSAAPIVALLLVAGDACVIHTLNICYKAEIRPCENILCCITISAKGVNCRSLMENTRV